MRQLVDASVLAAVFSGDTGAALRLAFMVQAGHELWGVTLTRAELLAATPPAAQAKVLAVLDRIRWADVTVEMADRAAARAAEAGPADADAVRRSLLPAAAELLGAGLQAVPSEDGTPRYSLLKRPPPDS